MCADKYDDVYFISVYFYVYHRSYGTGLYFAEKGREYH